MSKRIAPKAFCMFFSNPNFVRTTRRLFRSLGEFRKKIDEYIRVAQLQCERGHLDKAIDCNSHALKFCKDKDPECFKRLQAQNEELVARKLQESIARIERGFLFI